MKRILVVVANLSLCSVFGVAGYWGWNEGAPEAAVLFWALVLIGLLAVFDTITGRGEY